jgi:AcrR family transcriptional regulator
MSSIDFWYRHDVGLREEKKQQTRERLAHVATRLFIERGFDAVTIPEIATAAGVSKMTVTNYFPLKEDLVFDAHEQAVDSLARAVRERQDGEQAAAAVRRAYLAGLGGRDPVLTGHATAGFARLVHDTPRLRAREREIDELREEALAAALGDDLAARLAAARLAAAHRIVHRAVRESVRTGAPADEVDRVARQAAELAFG